MSYHSVLSTLTVGITAVALIQAFDPGMRETLGIPRLYNTELYTAGSWHAKITGFLWALVAVTGVLRLPPNSPRIRSLLFQQSAIQTVPIYMMQDSPVSLVDHIWAFDLLHWNASTVIFWILYLGSFWATGEFVSESIGGPDRGRETLPFNGHRFWFTLLAVFSYVGLVTLPPLILLNHDQEAFTSTYLPYLHRLEGTLNCFMFLSEAMVGMGMLVATLLFERKISQNQASLSLAVLVVVTGFLDVNIDIADLTMVETQAISALNSEILQTTHAYEIAFLSLCFFIMKGLWMYFQSKNSNNPATLRTTDRKR